MTSRLSSLTLLLGFALLTASCKRAFTPEDYGTVAAWLACSDCDLGQREAVASLGRRINPVLADVLDTVPALILEPVRIGAEDGWSPGMPIDQHAYVDQYVGNAEALARKRAAISLGDLRAEDELREALNRAIAGGYRPDIVRVIRGALSLAENGGPMVAEVRVMPSFVSLRLGTVGGLAAFVEDEFGNSLEIPPDWASSDTLVLAADSIGILTPISEGTAIVSASAGGVVGEAVVVVVGVGVVAESASHRLGITGGTNQSGLVGSPLPTPVVVTLTDSAGSPVAGAPVDFSVTQGGGAVVPGRSFTAASGRASARWTLGTSAGPQRLEARTPGVPGVVFRAEAIHGPPVRISLEPRSTVVQPGEMTRLRLSLADSEGNEWIPGTVTWSSSPDDVVRLVGDGVVFGLAEGLTRVEAQAGGLVSSSMVLVSTPVTADPVPVMAAISGQLFLDEAPKNDQLDPGEPSAPFPAVSVLLLDGAAVPWRLTHTDTMGRYLFEDLPLGPYSMRFWINADWLPRPEGIEEGWTGTTPVLVDADSLFHLDLPLDVVEQHLVAHIRFGSGAPPSAGGVGPLVGLDLYPTLSTAQARDLAQRIPTSAATGLGQILLRFDRADDYGPSGPETDGRVYSVVTALPDPSLRLVSDSVTEWTFPPTAAFLQDTIFLLSESTNLQVSLATGPKPLAGWEAGLFRDTTASPDATALADASGEVSLPLVSSLARFPDTVFVGIVQGPGPIIPISIETGEGRGFREGSFLKYVFEGLSAPSEELRLGWFQVRFGEVTVRTRVLHEKVTSGGGGPPSSRFDLDGVANVDVTLFDVSSGAAVPIETGTPDPMTGEVLFERVPTPGTFMVAARSTVDDQIVVSDTVVALTPGSGWYPNGHGRVVDVCPVFDSGSLCVTLTHRFENGRVVVQIPSASPFAGEPVLLCPDPLPSGTIPSSGTCPTTVPPTYFDNGALQTHTFTRVVEGNYRVHVLSGAAPSPRPVTVSGSGAIQTVSY